MIRIGIVDDEETMRLKIHQCIKEILKEQEEVEIRSYDCAEAFLEEIQKKVYFDILFSDIQMLEMNGLELGKRLQKDMPNLYIIYITAYMEYAVESYRISAYRKDARKNCKNCKKRACNSNRMLSSNFKKLMLK